MRDKCSTYSSTRLTRGTRVSWEADRTLQTDRDTEKTEPDSDIWHRVNNNSGSRQLDWEIWHGDSAADSFNNASVMTVCVCVWETVELTYRVTLGTVISGGSAGTGRSSSSGWASFSLLTSLSSGALKKCITGLSPWRPHKGHLCHFDA